MAKQRLAGGFIEKGFEQDSSGKPAGQRATVWLPHLCQASWKNTAQHRKLPDFSTLKAKKKMRGNTK